MDSEPKLWLPSMPSENRVLKMKAQLHTQLIEKIQRNCRDDVILAFIEGLEPTDLKMDLDTKIYEEVDEDEDNRFKWMDSYAAEDVPEYPVFSLEGWYRPKNRIKRNDKISLSVTLDIDPGVLAESISLIQKKWRKTLANLVIASYVKDNKYLLDVIEEEIDETADALHFDEYTERQKEINEIQALMSLRNEIIDGVFGILPEFPIPDQKDLPDTAFPNEIDERGIERPAHWKYNNATSNEEDL